MAGATGGMEGRIEMWWTGLAVALLLLLPVDLLATLAAVAQHGLAVEANPLVRWLIRQGVVGLVVANVAAGVIAAYTFHVVVGIVRRTPGRRQRALAYGIDAWLVLVVLAGIALTANNLLVVV